jgi:hypothetical protein
MKKNKQKKLKEGYGAGFSYTGGRGFSGGMGGTSRGGFGGANNLGGPNMMYTYEIKPLNHILEPKSTATTFPTEEIQIGSVITGEQVISNANPEKKKVKGVVQKIVIADNGALKYYLIQDEVTQKYIKVNPLTVTLIIPEPIQYYFDASDTLPSKRKKNNKITVKESKIVRESIDEII